MAWLGAGLSQAVADGAAARARPVAVEAVTARRPRDNRGIWPYRSPVGY